MRNLIFCAALSAATASSVIGQQVAVADSVEVLNAAILSMLEGMDQEAVILVPGGGQASVITASAIAVKTNLEVQRTTAGLKCENDDITCRPVRGVALAYADPVIRNHSATVTFKLMPADGAIELRKLVLAKNKSGEWTVIKTSQGNL